MRHKLLILGNWTGFIFLLGVGRYNIHLWMGIFSIWCTVNLICEQTQTGISMDFHIWFFVKNKNGESIYDGSHLRRQQRSSVFFQITESLDGFHLL